MSTSFSKMNTHEQARPTASKTTKVDSRRDKQAIHWRVPTVMLGSLLAGTTAAVGHHLFYMHYDNRPVRDTSEQKYLSNGGTAFAFLVRMFLAIATGTAYVQLFWLSLRTSSYRLERVDRMYSVLGNITVFWDLGLWFRNPLLSILAIVTWMLPLAVIITPGTLTVQTFNQTSQLMTIPPQLSFNSSSYVVDNNENPDVDGGQGKYTLYGPQSQVMAIAVGAAVQQAILSITPPHINASYHLHFVAPALKCVEPPQSNITTFHEALDIQQTGSPNEVEVGGLVYNAWAPDESHADLSNPNWNNGSSVYIDNTDGKYPGGTTFIYINHWWDYDYEGIPVYEKMVLLQCTLYNATYDIQFRFSGTDQDIRISNLAYLNPVPVAVDANHVNYGDPSRTYTAIMWAFNQLLVGSGTTNPANGQTVPSYTGTLAQTTALRKFIEGATIPEFNAVKDIVEQIFQNITLSFLSSRDFLLNSTVSQSVNTTISIFQPRFLYQPRDIYVAYGSGILCSSICVIIGCIALFQNGVSYSYDLTTVIRTTRRKEITDLVAPKHSVGGEPLNKRSGHAVVQFKTREHYQHDADDDQDEMCGLTTLHSGASEKMMQHGEDLAGLSELPRPPLRGLSASPAIRRKPLPQQYI